MCNYNFARRLVEGYLHQPYSWFLNRHSADLGKTILAEVNVVIKSGLYPINGMTDKMVLNAVQKYIATNAKSFCGDSVDRERVRDIILADNNVILWNRVL